VINADNAQEIGSYYLRKGKGEPTNPVKPIPMPISVEEIYALAANETDLTKSLIFGLYLTGARISELLGLRSKDFSDYGDTAVNRQITVTLKTEKKRKGIPLRTLAIRSNHPTELAMLNHLLAHKATFDQLGKEKLYEIGRTVAWRNLQKLSFTTDLITFEPKISILEDQPQHLYPHFLRHCRATHLVTTYNINPFELQRYMGWTTLAPAIIYVNLDWRNTANLLMSYRPKEAIGEQFAKID
jgi:integrase